MLETSARVHVAPMRRFRADDASDLVYFPLSGGLRKLPRAVVDALDSSTQFSPLSSHAEALSPLFQDPDICLRSLTTAGAFIAYEDLTQCNSGHTSGSPCLAPLSCLAVPTRSRPRELKRALTSYLRSARHHDRAIEVIVVDDSRSADGEALTKATVAEVARLSRSPIYYAGMNEKSAFSDALHKCCGVPLDVVHFALAKDLPFPVTTGGSRNAILLHGAGKRLLTADDDTICHTGTLLNGRPRSSGLTISGEADGSDVLFFPDRPAAIQAMTPHKIDIFGEHDRVLGHSLEDILRQHCASGVRFDDPCSHLLESMRYHNGSVVAAFTGIVGDCGLYSLESIALDHRESIRRRFLASENSYQSMKQSREVGRQYPCLTVCHEEAPMTGPVGLDNRKLLPPFVPYFRNQDGVFMSTVRRCMPGAFFAHMPFAVVHNPDRVKANAKGWASRMRVSDVLLESIGLWRAASPASPAADNVISLGRHLTAISSEPLAGFRQTMRSLLVSREERIAHHHAEILRRFGTAPEYWRRDLGAQLEHVREQIARKDCLIPADLEGDVPMERIDAAMQILIRRFGELLYWWPTIIDGARLLCDRGVRLGRTLSQHGSPT